MCTALLYQTDHSYFGRTLDLEYRYHETVTVTPRGFRFAYRHTATPETSYALIGMATVADGYPLYYEATNEHGLAVAGLNFPHSAHYFSATPYKINLASFELIPYLLTQCRTLAEARERLRDVQLCNTAFNDTYPPSPLHWMIADKDGAFTVESTADGLQVYDNPVGVLTNEPPFPYHTARLSEFRHLSPHSRPHDYSRGLCAVGLPGDWSSPSRFVRAAFAKQYAVSDTDDVTQFFRILGTVETPRGCVQTAEGTYVITVYTSCMDLDRRMYYYTTYDNPTIRAVELHRYPLDGTALITMPLA